MEPRKIRIDEIEQVIQLTLEIREELDLAGIKSFLRWQKDLWYVTCQSFVPVGPLSIKFTASGNWHTLSHALHDDWPVVIVNRVKGKTLILVNSPVALEGISLCNWTFPDLVPNLNKDIPNRAQSIRDLKEKLWAGGVCIPGPEVDNKIQRKTFPVPGTWTEAYKGFNEHLDVKEAIAKTIKDHVHPPWFHEELRDAYTNIRAKKMANRIRAKSLVMDSSFPWDSIFECHDEVDEVLQNTFVGEFQINSIEFLPAPKTWLVGRTGEIKKTKIHFTDLQKRKGSLERRFRRELEARGILGSKKLGHEIRDLIQNGPIESAFEALEDQPSDCENILREMLLGTKLKGGDIQDIRVQDGNILISRCKGLKRVDEWIDTWGESESILEQIRTHRALSLIGSPEFDGHEVRFRAGNCIEVWDGEIWVAPGDHPNSEYRDVFGRTGGMLPDEFDFGNRTACFLRAMRLYMLNRGFAHAWTCTGVSAADDALTFRMSRGQARMEVCIAAAEVRHFQGGTHFFRGFHQLLALKIQDHQ